MAHFFRRLVHGLPLSYRARRRWEWSKSFPLPRYTGPTPTVDGFSELGIFLPPNPATLGAAIVGAAAPEVEAVLARLEQTEEVAGVRTYYRASRERFGVHWRYADLLTTLWAAATLSAPWSYLEVGVRTGRSAAIVGAAMPECAIYGFDLWPEAYDGAANPGPEFAREQLRAGGHTGEVELIQGDSRKTLPAFLQAHPELYFDLITVDGAKSTEIWASDLAAVLPRLKVGGILVSDDIFLAPHLGRLWDEVIRHDSRYVTWEFAQGGVGVAAAIRMSDGPVLAPLG